MAPVELVLNEAGRLRSGWRLGIFVVLYAASLLVLGSMVRFAYWLTILLKISVGPFAQDLTFRFLLLAAALLAGWICNRWIEGLPWRALGLNLHDRWLRDLLIGTAIGIASLVVAALIAFAAGGLRFTFSGKELLA